MYHQITELYFKLTLHEMRQLEAMDKVDLETFKIKLGRINRYFSALTHSFWRDGKRDGPRPIFEVPNVADSGQRLSECAVPDD